ncbi:MAG: hypothetical protein FJX06_12375, partial [Alphaproteobacteria bacterium]|nr:hypothetical protein [Alphaproteobacteria bacterium]
MNELGAPNESSDDDEKRTREERAAQSDLETAVAISTCAPATLVAACETSDVPGKLEIKINLGFDDSAF